MTSKYLVLFVVLAIIANVCSFPAEEQIRRISPAPGAPGASVPPGPAPGVSQDLKTDASYGYGYAYPYYYNYGYYPRYYGYTYGYPYYSYYSWGWPYYR